MRLRWLVCLPILLWSDERKLSPQERELCRCALEARREAWRRGVVDFNARVQGPALQITTGPPFVVGRIEFRGHHRNAGTTLRRAMLLDEADPLDPARLRRSLDRLNRTGLVNPLDGSNVTVYLDRATGRANVTLSITEAPRGQWSLSGPLWLPGSVRFRLESRLPAFATWMASLDLVSWPLLGARYLFVPMVSLERSLLPGRRWQSGWRFSPQLGWRGTLAAWAGNQVWGLLFRGPQLAEPPLAVSREGGTLLCGSEQGSTRAGTPPDASPQRTPESAPGSSQ